jgi:hypothetical protein
MKSFIRITMAIAVLAPLAVMTAAPAGAAAVLTCTTQAGSATIKPGITPKATNVTISVSEKLSGCKGSPGVTTGTETASFVNKAATCSGLAKKGTKTGPFTAKLTWSNKKTSTVSLTTVSNVLTATATGKVTAGLFVGKKIATTITYGLKTGNCTSTPLTALTIKGTKPFVIS